MADTSLMLTIEPELHARFMAEADAAHRSAAEVLRDLPEEFVNRQIEGREHDAWFRVAVEEALREVDDPNTVMIPHEQVMAGWAVKRTELVKRSEAE